jgi:hypothetical protein
VAMELRSSTELGTLAAYPKAWAPRGAKRWGSDAATGAPQPGPLGNRRGGEALRELLREAAASPGEASLQLAWHCIGLEAARILAGGLRNCPALTALNLSSNALGDGGVLAIAQALGGAPGAGAGGGSGTGTAPPPLRSLHLSGNGIGDSGAVALAQLVVGRPGGVLEELGLNGNDIGDRGAAEFARALRVSGTARKVWMGSCRIGEEGSHALAEVLEAKPEQYEVLWLGKQRPAVVAPGQAPESRQSWQTKLIREEPRQLSTGAARRQGAMSMLGRTMEAEATRRHTWTDTSQYGNLLAESVDSGASCPEPGPEWLVEATPSRPIPYLTPFRPFSKLRHRDC